ncbi:hypothetical protein Tco_0810698 [Tanacetum coccineum]
MLKSEFEKVKQEKEGIEFKVEKFDKASKDLDKLLGSLITEKSKKGFRYSVVPPPHPLIYNRSKKLDLSYSGLDEFKEPEFKGPNSAAVNVVRVNQKKQSRRKQRKDTAVSQEETQQDDNIPIPSNDPLLRKRVQKLERKKKSRPIGLKRLRKVGKSRRVESSKDKDSLGDHEDASKQERSIEDIDKDGDVSLVDDTQGRSDNEEIFDTNDLHGDEVNVDMPVGEKQEQSAKEREVDTSVEDSAAPTTIEEITLAQTLIQIKAAKPKVITTAATTTTTTRPKAKGVVEHELKEERLARKKEEEANIALIESWDNTQAMIEADFELPQRLQPEEQ